MIFCEFSCPGRKSNSIFELNFELHHFEVTQPAKTCANDFSMLELSFDTNKLLSNQVEHQYFDFDFDNSKFDAQPGKNGFANKR